MCFPVQGGSACHLQLPSAMQGQLPVITKRVSDVIYPRGAGRALQTADPAAHSPGQDPGKLAESESDPSHAARSCLRGCLWGDLALIVAPV